MLMSASAAASCRPDLIVQDRLADRLAGSRTHTLLGQCELDMSSREAAEHDLDGLTSGVTQLLRRILPSKGAGASERSVSSTVTDSTKSEAGRSQAALNDNLRQLKAREEAASELWDLTQSETTASIGVQYSALDILPQVVMHDIVHKQFRIAELLMGALANILCHPSLAEQVKLCVLLFVSCCLQYWQAQATGHLHQHCCAKSGSTF